MNPRMLHLVIVAVATALLTGGGLAALAAAPARHASTRTSGTRFGYLDVYVRTDDWALGAWQAEVKIADGKTSLVGVEGGEGAFSEAPTYDAVALSGARVIVGGMRSAAGPVASGRVRVARLHTLSEGTAKYEAVLMASGDDAGARRSAEIELIPGSTDNSESK